MNEPLSHLPVSSADIDAAAKAIAQYAVRTPLLSPPVLCERVGAKVFLKPEILQRTGSFKIRGAFNKLASVPQNAAQGGRGGVFLRQPPPRGRGRRQDPQHASHHRDAGGFAAVEARAHQILWRR